VSFRVEKLFFDYMNHKKRTQVCYYRFRKLEINSLSKRQKTIFELILRGYRKSLFLPGFFSHNFETYTNEQLMTSRMAVTIETLICMCCSLRKLYFTFFKIKKFWLKLCFSKKNISKFRRKYFLEKV
jgi:hypothetical protein